MRLMSVNGNQGIQKALFAGVLSCALGYSVVAGPAQDAADAKKPTTTVLPWVSDVVKMSEAGVPSGVIQTFVKNSSARSTLTSDEVIYLQTKGVNTDVIGTMIEHGATPAPAAQVATAPTYPPVQQPATPVYPPPADYQAFQAQTDYGYAAPASTVSVNYIPYSNPSYYYGYSYPYYYPYYYYPYYYSSYYPYYYSYPYCGYSYYNGSAYCRYPYGSSAYCNPTVAPVGGGVRTPGLRGGSGTVVRNSGVGTSPVLRGGGSANVMTAGFSGGVSRSGGGGSVRVATPSFSGGISGAVSRGGGGGGGGGSVRVASAGISGGGGGGMRGGGGRR